MGAGSTTISKKSIRGFYLHPARSEGYNVAHGLVLILSWILGIVIQQDVEPRALGAAYFIFALSMLLEFFEGEGRRSTAKKVHGIFRGMILVMVVGAATLAFYKGSSEAAGEPDCLLGIISSVLFLIGWVLSAMMLASLVIMGFGEDATNGGNTRGEDDRIESFFNSLNGPARGGSKE